MKAFLMNTNPTIEHSTLFTYSGNKLCLIILLQTSSVQLLASEKVDILKQSTHFFARALLLLFCTDVSRA